MTLNPAWLAGLQTTNKLFDGTAGKASAASRKGAIASQAISGAGSGVATGTALAGVFSAAAAANAVPVAGQIASAGLAVAGLLTKIFVGRRQAKKEAAREKEAGIRAEVGESFQAQAPTGPSMGQSQGSIQPTINVQPPPQPGYEAWETQQPQPRFSPRGQ